MESRVEQKTTATPESFYQQGKSWLEKINPNDYNWMKKAPLYKEAVNCFLQAINAGFSLRIFSHECLSSLMMYFRYENYDLELQKEITVLLQRAVEHGCCEAQYEVGELCREGHDISQTVKLVLWSETGEHYADAEKKNSAALEWLRKSADQGYVEAQLEIAEICSYNNPAEALRIYCTLAEQDNESAAYSLSLAYSDGSLGLRKNPIAATKWLKKTKSHAADLVERYADGDGLPQNKLKAARLFCQNLETYNKKADKETIKQLDNLFVSKFPDECKSPISYSTACIIFYVARAYFILPIWARKGDAAPHESDGPICARMHTSVMINLPSGECIPEDEYYSSSWFNKIGQKVEENLVFLITTYPNLFYSLLKQIPVPKREEFLEGIAHLHKQTISDELDGRNIGKINEITKTLTMLPIVLQHLIIDFTGEDYLFMENLEICVTSVEENLYGFQEDPESPEAKCCQPLLEKIQPFKNFLSEPISHDHVYASILRDWAGFLSIEKVSIPNNPLYSEVLRVLDEGIRQARGYLPSDTDRLGLITLGLYKPVDPRTPWQYRTTPKIEESKLRGLTIHH